MTKAVVEPAAGSPQLRIAINVLKWATLGLLALAVAMVVAGTWAAEKKGDPEILVRVVDKILTALLPLLGTWVGTILAFYFSKDSFESASRQTSDQLKIALNQRLEQLLAEPSMRPRSAITAVVLQAGQDEGALLLKTIRALYGGPISRVPVFDAQGRILYVIHKSLIDEYLTARSEAAFQSQTTLDLSQTNLQELLSHGSMRETARDKLAFVKRTATLADAKLAMERIAGCQDVFVTENGRRDDVVLGWLTNTRISRLATA